MCKRAHEADEPFTRITVRKLIKDNPGTPVIVIAMNNTGYACIPKSRIMGPDDAEHINMAVNFLRTHIKAILDDGAALYFLSPKKYWRDLSSPLARRRYEGRNTSPLLVSPAQVTPLFAWPPTRASLLCLSDRTPPCP